MLKQLSVSELQVYCCLLFTQVHLTAVATEHPPAEMIIDRHTEPQEYG
jgi:hypothetical protein